MNHKLFGKNLFRSIVLLILVAGTMAACSLDKIAGDPAKVLKEFIAAVQKNDFNTMYALNNDTARQEKWLKKGESGDVQKQRTENFQRSKEFYDTAVMSFSPGVRWAEKFFFPPSAKVVIGKPRDPEPVEKEKMGDAYEKGMVAVITVAVTYPVPEEAPEFHDAKLKYAEYNCMLRKIRQEGSVMIYSYDDKWFFSGCIINSNSVQ